MICSSVCIINMTRAYTITCIYYRCIIANAIYMYMLSVSIAVKTIILWFCNFAVFAYAVCFEDQLVSIWLAWNKVCKRPELKK